MTGRRECVEKGYTNKRVSILVVLEAIPVDRGNMPSAGSSLRPFLFSCTCAVLRITLHRPCSS